jgi:two-component sensor histidine kinase
MHVASNQTSSSKSRHIPIKIGEAWANNSDQFLLLREMVHRINNELTSTIGIISCAADCEKNRKVKVALINVIEHLYDQARTYRALQMPTPNKPIDAAAYLRELCQSISRAKLRHNGIKLVLSEQPLQLNSGQCWRLGLIVSELITNASRHAFRDTGGTIRVELRKLGTTVECRVTDDGSGPENIGPGQGLEIIQQLARALNGEVDQRFGAMGAAAIVSFPIEEVTPS